LVKDNLNAAIDTRAPASVFSGMTSLPKWLRIMSRQDVAHLDSTALSELNLTNGWFAPESHSIQAIVTEELEAIDFFLMTDSRLPSTGVISVAGDEMALTTAARNAAATATRDAILNRVLSGNHDTVGTVGKVIQDTLTKVDAAKTAAESASTLLSDGTYGLAKLVRSATPARALAVNADGSVDSQATVDEAALAAAVAARLGDQIKPVIVGPLQSTLAAPESVTLGPSPIPLSVFTHTRTVFPVRVVDSNGDAVAIGSAVRFVVHDEAGEVVWQLDSSEGDITTAVGGDGVVTVTVTIPAASVGEAGDWNFKLWDLTNAVVLATGRFVVRIAPVGVAP
jgi:hypothetical protein